MKSQMPGEHSSYSLKVSQWNKNPKICAFADCPYLVGDENGGVAAASLELHVDHVDHEELSSYMKSTGDLRFRALIEPLKEQGIWNFPYDIFISVMLTQKTYS